MDESCWFFVLNVAGWVVARHTAAAAAVIAETGVIQLAVHVVSTDLLVLIAQAAFGVQ